MAQNAVAVRFVPLTPDAVISAFNYLRAVEADDVDAAAEFASEEEQLPALLLDVAERIVIPVTALPGVDEDDSCAESFALAELGTVFLSTLRSWREQAGDGAAEGIARAVVRFAAQMLTEPDEDVARTLEQLMAVALGQALEAHPAGTTAV